MLIFPWTYNLWFAQYKVRATSSTLQWHMMQYFSQRKNDREWMPVFVITGKQLALQWRIYAGNFLLFIDIFNGIFITSYRNSDILMNEYSSLFLWWKFISNWIRIVKTINWRCLFWDVLEIIFVHFFCVGHFGIFPFGILPLTWK